MVFVHQTWLFNIRKVRISSKNTREKKRLTNHISNFSIIVTALDNLYGAVSNTEYDLEY